MPINRLCVRFHPIEGGDDWPGDTALRVLDKVSKTETKCYRDSFQGSRDLLVTFQGWCLGREIIGKELRGDPQGGLQGPEKLSTELFQ